MFRDNFWVYLLPPFVFFGLIGIGLVLKRILPASTTLTLSKPWLFALIGFGLIQIVMLTVLILLLLRAR